MITGRRVSPVSSLTIASDRALDELRAALRAELMHEFRIAPPPIRRWGTLALVETPASQDTRRHTTPPRGELEAYELGANTHTLARIVRLCIDPTTPDLRAWSVARMAIGCEPLTIGPEPIPAAACSPLPKWITETPAELANVPELVRALEAFPVANVPPTTTSPGLVAAVTLKGPPGLTPPRAWFLCELPTDELGALAVPMIGGRY